MGASVWTVLGMRLYCSKDLWSQKDRGSVLFAVALDRWEAMKMAWKANKADWGFDVEAAAQNGHLLGSAPEGPAVALLHSDAERREFISAGAAAGLAASSCLFPDHLLQFLSCI